MCDSLEEGGRRCPGCNGAERSAYRKAFSAAQSAPEGGIGGGGATLTDVVPFLSDAWDRERVSAVCGDLTDALHVPRGYTDDDTLFTREQFDADYDRQHEYYLSMPETTDDARAAVEAEREGAWERYQVHARLERIAPTREGVVRVVGDAVAAEAERRAGVDLTQLQERQHGYEEAVKRELEESRRAAENAELLAGSSDTGWEAREAEEAYQAVNGKAADIATWRMAARRRAETKAAHEATEDYRVMVSAQERLAAAEENFRRGVDEQTEGELARLAQSYREVLTELRPMGGEGKFHELSEAEMVPHMGAVMADFPTDWVEQNNRTSPGLLVRETLGRAHYKASGEPIPGHPLGERASVLLVSEDHPDGPDARANPYHRVGVHEMAHRFQHIVPGVTELEREFLRRRTTDPATGRREALVDLGAGMAGERARPDAFVSAYIGKEYRDSNATEVMSMGMESLFTGTHGGLVGAGRYAADADMRAFVLGVLATAGRSAAR